MKTFHFGQPYFLYFLLLVPLYIFFRYRMLSLSAVQTVSAPEERKTHISKYGRLTVFLMIETFLLLSAGFGAADPYYAVPKTKVSEDGIDLALVLDVSASMQAADFSPNRLEKMKETAKDFIRNTPGARTGIFIFAQECFTQTPLTNDRNSLLNFTDSISYYSIDHNESGGTAIGVALLSAAETLLRMKIPKRDQAVILITDGENSYGIDPVTVAKYLKENSIRLYIIGMAGPNPIKVYVNGSPFITPAGTVLETSLDDESLRKISDAAGGKYFRAHDGEKFSEILKELSRMERTPLEVGEIVEKYSFADKAGAAVMLFLLLRLLFSHYFFRRPVK
ncbi:MAG TPA: VWA domain-containing protein [Leptospiraceae bacterium]|nr:VWA domain-containing protein [Leptospiraceae bacterium]HMZ58510.1 VWA domain-containing protein [Leptospiraceae bacterium]HNM04801.1 VWA domain-containing protein [Leptospiraceae bacterium]HNN02446.1 VWA domain-containing protein [Leptospiraceae bacterium]HNO21817.1 VWA domain-containing protein [Leptospiraceae bacterium]